MAINQLITEDSARESFEDYVVGRSLISGQGLQFSLQNGPLESKLGPIEANKPGYGLNMVDNDDEMIIPEQVMPECCQVHQDEFKSELKVENLTFSEQKSPLIAPKSRVFEPILKLYDTGKKGLEYALDRVKDVSYGINQKASSLYKAIKEDLSPKIEYSRTTLSYV